jgi:hypothetical protein
VTDEPLNVKELQQNFYTQKQLMRVRRGPAGLDEDRSGGTIGYDVPPAGFPYPVSLVAPPILLQTRKKRSAKCIYDLGSEYNNKVWDTATQVTCRAPYECPEDLMTVPDSLMACSAEDSPEVFFGKAPMQVGGKLQFYEFLQSVADAPLLVRNKEARSTRAFLDSQTEQISCLMIAFSAQYGIASTLQITADIAADVKLDYKVTHFQSLEGDDLYAYTQVTILALVLSTVLFVEKVLTVRNLVWEHVKHGFFWIWWCR